MEKTEQDEEGDTVSCRAYLKELASTLCDWSPVSQLSGPAPETGGFAQCHCPGPSEHTWGATLFHADMRPEGVMVKDGHVAASPFPCPGPVPGPWHSANSCRMSAHLWK